MNLDSKEIWARFSNELSGFIESKIFDKDVSRDILQTIFLKIHSKIETLKHQGKVRGWIYQIAKTTLTDYYREEMKKKNLSELNNTQFNESSFNESDEILAAGLKKIIGILPRKYADVLNLIEYEGLSQNQVAEKLGISISCTKSRAQRGRLKFKELLLQFCHIEFDTYGTPLEYYPNYCETCKKKIKVM